ncbi:MAG: spondin domain-containing protein [Myxococcales bacterium]|nr:spondin domain-containing protein [Myxococcales bacterium]MCB9737464.1 spondin domain-containing protein [Deltaproteobacteria bacterium]
MRFSPVLQVVALVCPALAGLPACSDDDGGSTTTDGAQRFKVTIENVAPFTNRKAGSFAVKVGATDPGPIAPGEAYEVTFTAGPGHRLVFATMFGQSNDWFFAPDPMGIALFDSDKNPVTGDVTAQVKLWDAGTEVDEEPAVGAHTGPKQKDSTDGPGAADPDTDVREVPLTTTLTDGSSFTRPAVADMIAVTLSADAATRTFTLRIENVSEDGVTLMTSEGGKPVRVSPGVWALGTTTEPIFSEGAPDRGEGLEGIAEGGDIAALAAALPMHSGVATPLSPAVWLVHDGGMPFFTVGEPDYGMGLEAVAETGDVSVLAGTYSDMLPAGGVLYGTAAVPVGKSDPGPIGPGGSYEQEITASPGDMLSFVMMYGASNDWFFATPDDGLPLFSGTTPVSGDVTGGVAIYDAGTEADEELAIGVHGGKPEGPADPDDTVREVTAAEYGTPVTQHIKVTVTPLGPAQ